jgi:hypothetical protein
MGPVPGMGPEMPPLSGIQPEAAGLGNFDVNGPELPPAPETPTQAFDEALTSNYYALQERMQTNPVPTLQELEIGAFIEEIQPQAREAVLLMRQKGYDIGNVLHAGFKGENHDSQGMTFQTPLSHAEEAMLSAHGFVIEDGQLNFRPENPTDLGSIKGTWDWLANNLPDLGEPAAPSMFGNAVAFREAAANGTLQDAYMPNGRLDMVGTKYVRERDPFADMELFLSPDAVSATRELTFIDQFHALGNRIANNPMPTDEEWNMGAYKEEIEPQVRDAVMVLRQKGYNTGSSGFWGHDHVDQVMDIATPIDDNSKARLAEHDIKVTETGIRFTPENPSNLESVKKTWDLIADILPDLGKHAEPAQSIRADVFRHAMRNGKYGDYMETWVWQTGALNGHMQPLTMTMLNEGYSFGDDVYAPARLAEARFHEMEQLAQQEKEQGG